MPKEPRTLYVMTGKSVDATGKVDGAYTRFVLYVPFLVPAVAWQLRLHTSQVELESRAPAVVFRERTTSGRRAVPTLRALDGVAGVRTAAVGENWRIVTACRGAGG